MAYSTNITKENTARRNKHQELVVERRNGELIGPDLSWTIDWHPKTREWWDSWRASDQAIMFEQTDWEELESAALIHHKIWNTEHKISVAQLSAGLAELRQRVAKFGATYEDRLKLRMKFADASVKEDKMKDSVRKKDYRAALGADDAS
jgi:hypothetical protein